MAIGINNKELLAVILCFLGAMRLVVLQPTILGAWSLLYEFDEAQLGYLAAVELGIAAVVILLAGVWLKAVRSRPLFIVSLIAFLVLDYLSFHVSSFNWLLALRGISGFFTGLSAAVISIHLSRARDPGQAFGLSIFVQWALPGVALYFIPEMIDTLGPTVMFYVMAALIVSGLLALPFTSTQPLAQSSETEHARDASLVKSGSPRLVPGVALLLSCLIFAMAGGYWAFAERIADTRGLIPSEIGEVLALASFGAVVGSLSVSFLERRLGALRSVLLFLCLVVAALFGMIASQGYVAYLLGTLTIATTWGVVPPMLFAVLVASTHQQALIASIPGVHGIGMAAGPLLLGPLLAQGSVSAFSVAIIILALLQLVMLPALRGVEVRAT